MRQLITIMDTSASVEQRVSEAEQAIAASDRDSLAKQVGLLTEALKSTAIDVTKILSSEVSDTARSEEHTSELQSLMRNSYAVFCLKQKIQKQHNSHNKQ